MHYQSSKQKQHSPSMVDSKKNMLPLKQYFFKNMHNNNMPYQKSYFPPVSELMHT